MRKIFMMMFAAFMIGSTQQVQAQPNPRYKIHETPATKKHIIRGGVNWLGIFSEGFAIVGKGGSNIIGPKSFYVIDKTGNKVFDLPDGYKPSLQGHYESLTKIRFNSGRLLIEKEENYKKTISIINTRGEVIKTFKEAIRASQFRDGIAVIELNHNQPMIIDVNGNIITKTISLHTNGNYYWPGPLREGMRYYKDSKTRKYGFLDANCNIVIPPKFNDVESFSNGLAAAQNDEGIWGFIDKTGNYVIEPMFSNKPGNFHSGYAKVEDKSHNYHYMNTNGRIVYTASTQGTITDFSDSGFVIVGGVIMNTQFNKVAESPFSRVYQVGNSWFTADTGWGVALLDYAGDYLLKYDSDRAIFDNIGVHFDYYNDCYYFNLKGEIIAVFKDTQF